MQICDMKMLNLHYYCSFLQDHGSNVDGTPPSNEENYEKTLVMRGFEVTVQ